jgi:hypothetical protein
MLVGVKTTRLLDEELSTRPRIVVVDFGRVIDTIGPGAPPELLDAVAARMRADVNRLVGAGFLVLDAGAIQGSPQDLLLPIAPISQPPLSPQTPYAVGGAQSGLVPAARQIEGAARTTAPVVGPGSPPQGPLSGGR